MDTLTILSCRGGPAPSIPAHLRREAAIGRCRSEVQPRAVETIETLLLEMSRWSHEGGQWVFCFCPSEMKQRVEATKAKWPYWIGEWWPVIAFGLPSSPSSPRMVTSLVIQPESFASAAEKFQCKSSNIHGRKKCYLHGGRLWVPHYYRQTEVLLI